MEVVRPVIHMSGLSMEAKAKGQSITLVPTMGALHEGHLSLFREGRRLGDLLVASIFVNPRQFNDPKDYEKYTRDLPGDLKKCEAEKVAVVFTPSEDEIYPPDDKTAVPLPAVALPLEGTARPGHFQGVIEVVSRLFRIVRPDKALFGLKDYQQLRVIEEMVRGQGLNTQIIRHPIVRDKDGLALSSRNARLSPEGRRRALSLSRSIAEATRLFTRGERNLQKIGEAVGEILRADPAVTVDYVAVVDAETLGKPHPDRPVLVAVAAFVEGVRLIDNCVLGD